MSLSHGRGRHVVVLLAPLLLATIVGCSSPRGFQALPEPETVTTLEATSTSRPDRSQVRLREVRGTTTTTTVAIVGAGGDATLVGRVDGPNGPVGGATVLIERFVGGEVAAVMVPTAPDGTWNLPDVLGGRYRIRAWRVPDLALIRPTILFLRSGQTRGVEQRLELVERERVDTVAAPNPPIVDEPTNLKVRLSTWAVDDDGIVRSRPRPGVSVRLGGTGSWSVRSANPVTTGSDGSATFTLVCQTTGRQPLVATLDGTDTVMLVVADCTTAPTTTTTTDGTATTDPGGGSGTTTTTTEGKTTTTADDDG
ncbi:MAG TPA: carboxypeptidase-like regulatory domain-containing protein [Acidimicrobiales bacterium]|nr:carboxypeptidase-like regulatory domain-containing protein [Acidimicrobiales bacterium]